MHKLRLPSIPGFRKDGKPAFVDNARVPMPHERTKGGDLEQTINVPLWPDDEYGAHPMSPQPQKVSPIAIRVLATLSGISDFGPRRIRVTHNGAITTAPERGSFLRSQEGALDVANGATITIGRPPAGSLFIANDDAANAITFKIANRMNTGGTAPDYSQATTQTLPAGSAPVGLDVTAYGVQLPATGNASAYRVWWIV